MSGQLADYFKEAIDFGEEDEATNPSEVLPTDDQLLLNTPGATQRLWHLHLTELAMSGQSEAGQWGYPNSWSWRGERKLLTSNE